MKWRRTACLGSGSDVVKSKPYLLASLVVLGHPPCMRSEGCGTKHEVRLSASILFACRSCRCFAHCVFVSKESNPQRARPKRGTFGHENSAVSSASTFARHSHGSHCVHVPESTSESLSSCVYVCVCVSAALLTAFAVNSVYACLRVLLPSTEC